MNITRSYENSLEKKILELEGKIARLRSENKALAEENEQIMKNIQTAYKHLRMAVKDPEADSRKTEFEKEQRILDLFRSNGWLT